MNTFQTEFPAADTTATATASPTASQATPPTADPQSLHTRSDARPATPHEVLLAVSNISLIYDDAHDKSDYALKNVTLQLYAGERLCILGANGSGKSTLASVLCGLLAPDAGSVQLLGEQVFREGQIDLDAYRRARRGIGLVFQNPGDQIVTSVVAEDIAFGPENLGVPSGEIAQRVERELHRVALDAYATADPRRLSGGQQQRVAIAGALAMEPRAIIFDEPGALLDVRGRRSILHVMDRLRTAGVAVAHITHYMEEALGADRVVVLDHGHIALEGTPAEVFSKESNLAQLGLEWPFAARLARKLRENGLPLPWVSTDEELLLELQKLASARKAQVSTTKTRTAKQPLATSENESATVEKQHATAEQQTPASKPTTAVQQQLKSEQTTVTVPTHATPVLAAEKVSFSYSADHKALDGVSLSIPAGAWVSIVGQTGSGKSTLLRLLCALELPDEGRVLIDGHATAGESHVTAGESRDTSGRFGKFRRNRRGRVWRAQLRSRVGYVMQRPERQLFATTVEEDVAFGPRNQQLSAADVQVRVDEALRICGLLDKRKASPFELSGGEQRLCAIAGVLACKPKALVLDEPTAGLDPQGRHELHRLLVELHQQGVTIVEVTHSMNAAALSEQVFVLNQSKLLAAGKPRAIYSRTHKEKLQSVGLGLPHALQWTYNLEDAGLVARDELGQPLSLDELVDAVVAHFAKREA